MRALVLAALACAGCSHVKPYEREHLAKPSMTPGTDQHTQAFEAHLRESREGATSSASAGGGGCGCN
jgi:Domain of unknown function (DUF4266)